MALAFCRKNSTGCQDYVFSLQTVSRPVIFLQTVKPTSVYNMPQDPGQPLLKNARKHFVETFFPYLFFLQCAVFFRLWTVRVFFGFFSVFQISNSFCASGGRGHIVESFFILFQVLSCSSHFLSCSSHSMCLRWFIVGARWLAPVEACQNAIHCGKRARGKWSEKNERRGWHNDMLILKMLKSARMGGTWFEPSGCHLGLHT